jgi:uncharacterized protein (TIGR03790 family)
MKAFCRLIFVISILGLLVGWMRAEAGDLAERVVIVVNEREADSVRVGEYYARKRGIPIENIVRIDAPTGETISRSEYLEFILNPLERDLFAGGWIQGMFSALPDSDGRSRSMVEGHRIAYLVLCRGVPLRIWHDPGALTPEMEANVREEFRTHAASVDSELALMMVRLPTVGFVPNPLFGQPSPGAMELNAVVKVARLDGPTADDAMALVDQALEAERKGLRGRAYVDLTGPHADGDRWLELTAKHIRELGFDVDLHEPRGMFPISVRFDAPVLYFGWYANNVGGPFLLPDFRFPPGAIALHIHSFSARTVRSSSEGWVGPLVARGVTATFGNVYEPYLALTHRPDKLLEKLRAGSNMGDAAAYAMPAFSWQGVWVGDPLYRPFAVSLDDQVAAAVGEDWDGLTAYSIGRRINLLGESGQGAKALELGRLALSRAGDPALALTMAKMQGGARNRRQALETLRMLSDVGAAVPAMEVARNKEVADLLSALGEHDRALAIYESLLAASELPVEIRKALLQDGTLLASRIGRQGQARDWQAELSNL